MTATTAASPRGQSSNKSSRSASSSQCGSPPLRSESAGRGTARGGGGGGEVGRAVAAAALPYEGMARPWAVAVAVAAVCNHGEFPDAGDARAGDGDAAAAAVLLRSGAVDAVGLAKVGCAAKPISANMSSGRRGGRAAAPADLRLPTGEAAAEDGADDETDTDDEVDTDGCPRPTLGASVWLTASSRATALRCVNRFFWWGGVLTLAGAWRLPPPDPVRLMPLRVTGREGDSSSSFFDKASSTSPTVWGSSSHPHSSSSSLVELQKYATHKHNKERRKGVG